MVELLRLEVIQETLALMKVWVYVSEHMTSRLEVKRRKEGGF
jgi:hypothetical protein